MRREDAIRALVAAIREWRALDATVPRLQGVFPDTRLAEYLLDKLEPYGLSIRDDGGEAIR